MKQPINAGIKKKPPTETHQSNHKDQINQEQRRAAAKSALAINETQKYKLLATYLTLSNAIFYFLYISKN
jgi:hypothetical protein